MPFRLEYATEYSVGWFAVEGANFSDAVAKAVHALRGLGCNSAVLRETSSAHHTRFGEGPVLAAFTRSTGWTMQKNWPGL